MCLLHKAQVHLSTLLPIDCVTQQFGVLTQPSRTHAVHINLQLLLLLLLLQLLLVWQLLQCCKPWGDEGLERGAALLDCEHTTCGKQQEKQATADGVSITVKSLAGPLVIKVGSPGH
jgi:hypothetical protein